EIPDTLQVIFIGGFGCNRVGALVSRLGKVQHLKLIRHCLLGLLVHFFWAAGIGIILVVLHKVAGVVGYQIELTVFEFGHIHFALANLKLAFHLNAFILKHLGIDFGYDFIGIVCLGPNNNGIRRVGSVALVIQRIGIGTAGGKH